MSLDSDIREIFSLLGEFLHALGLGNRPQHNKTRMTGFSSPIRSAWTNLGGFTPGVYLNETHKNGHYGVDMQAPKGTPVYAFAPGKVLSAGQSPGNTAGGTTITILHDKGLMTYYAHLSSVDVRRGEEVDSSTKIGSVGNTGNAQHTAPHLHFEIHANVNPKNPNSNWNGTAVDPSNYMQTPPYGKKQRSRIV